MPPTAPPSGSVSAEESHRLMVEALDRVALASADENIFVGDRLARTLRSRLAKSSFKEPLERWLVTYQLAKAELFLGNETVSIQLYEQCHQLLGEDAPSQVKKEILRQFYFDTAVAYLRRGETQNCCQRNTPGSCLLPIEGDAVHQNPAGARQAIEWLMAVLKLTDTDEPMHLAARWLLNLAFMTIGNYPAGVPADYLIADIGAKANGAMLPRFNNVAAQAGVASFSLAGGAVGDDFDNDGFVDLVVSSSDPRVPLRVFWNRGDGTFVHQTTGTGLERIRGGLNMVQTDYNDDGYLDIFVLRGAWLGAAGQHPNSLLRNNGDRTFTDVTFATGLAMRNFPSQAADWADFDLDGDLDVYVGNESSNDLQATSQLFRNNGDGTFEDVAQSAHVSNDLLAKAVAWGDYDDDRYPDLYVSNYRGVNRLFRNRADGTFVNQAKQLGVEGPHASFPAWFWDVNNDGLLDLFVSAYSGGIAEVAASMLGLPFDREATLPRLYLNNAQGFRESADAWHLRKPVHPMGANYGDVDSDGFLDFYLGTGWPEYHELTANVLYQNLGGERFVEATTSARVGHLQKGHAVVMADFDNDGDLDIFEQMGGFVPGDKYYDVLYRNPGSGNRWLKVKLVGQESCRAAIGARIHVVFEQDGSERSVYRHVNSGGSFGGNPLEQHLGLGQASNIKTLEVFWPRTGKTEVFTEVPLDSRLQIVEGQGEFDLRK